MHIARSEQIRISACRCLPVTIQEVFDIQVDGQLAVPQVGTETQIHRETWLNIAHKAQLLRSVAAVAKKLQLIP